MSVSILVLLILVLVLTLCLWVGSYCYYYWYKHLYYKTTPYKLTLIWPLIVLSVLFLVFTVLSFIYTFSVKATDFFIANSYIPTMSLIILMFLVMLIIWLVASKTSATKVKHFIRNFWSEDFKTQLIGVNCYQRMDFFSKKVKTRHKKYWHNMNADYNEILNLVVNNASFEKLVVELIKFNEKYTPKFSYGYYVVHIKMFLEICVKIRER